MSFCSETCILPGGSGFPFPLQIGMLLDFCVHTGPKSTWAGSRIVDPGNKFYNSMMCLICRSVRQVPESTRLTAQRFHLHSVTLKCLSQVHVGDIFEAILGLFVLKTMNANASFSSGFQCDAVADSFGIADYEAAVTELYVLRLLTKWGRLMIFGKLSPSFSSRVLFDFLIFYLGLLFKGSIRTFSIKGFFRMFLLTAGFRYPFLEVFLGIHVFK